MMTSKRVVTVATFTLTLAVAGCGADKESSGGGLSTAASATAAGASGTDADESNSKDVNVADDAPKDDNAISGDESGEAKNAEGKGNDGEVPTISNPFEGEGIEVPNYQPIAGGIEGSAEDVRQIQDVAYTVSNPPSYAEWTRTILDNSCAAVREPTMQQFESQGLSLDQVEEIMKSQGNEMDIPKTDVSVSDVRVDGERASATVTTTNSGGSASQVQLFAREDGRWKVCTDQ